MPLDALHDTLVTSQARQSGLCCNWLRAFVYENLKSEKYISFKSKKRGCDPRSCGHAFKGHNSPRVANIYSHVF